MEGKLQTSFIPKKPIVETKARKNPTGNIFSIVAWFIFIASVGVAAGIYFYEGYLTNAIATRNTDLSNILKNFDNASVDHFVQLDTQLQQASTLLGNHLAFSTLLGLIGDNTLQSVQLTSLHYNYDDGGKVSMSFTGKAPDFASVALQSDRLFAVNYLKNKSFAGIGLAPDGGVNFSFSSTIDPAVLLYSRTLTVPAASTTP